MREQQNHCETIAQLEIPVSRDFRESEKGTSKQDTLETTGKRSLDSDSGKETDSRESFAAVCRGTSYFLGGASRVWFTSVWFIGCRSIDPTRQSMEETPISDVERRCIRAIYHESLRDSTHRCNDRALLHLRKPMPHRQKQKTAEKELMTVTSFPYLGRDCCASRCTG